MELNVALLKEICKNYDVEFIENGGGGFQFSNKEMKKVVDKMVRCKYTFERIFFQKVPPEQILEEINKQEMILKDLKEKYPNLLFEFLDNQGYIYDLVFKPKDPQEEDLYKYKDYEDDEFISDVYEIIEKYINDDEYDEVMVLYDILNEIKEGFLNG